MPTYIQKNLNNADMNTKTHGGDTVHKYFFAIIGFKCYSPHNSEHYKFLELHLYNIDEHRGTFLLNEIKTNCTP